MNKIVVVIPAKKIKTIKNKNILPIQGIHVFICGQRN